MSGLDTKTNGEARKPVQLPTPEPDDVGDRGYVASSKDGIVANGKAKNKSANGIADVLQNASALSENLRPKSQGEKQTPTPSSTPNDDAVLSDNSERERSRPPPQIRRPGDDRRRSSVSEHEKLLKLSPKQIRDLTNEPASIPVRVASPIPEYVLEGKENGDTEEEVGLKGRSPGALEPAIELNMPADAGGQKRRASSALKGTHTTREGDIVVTKTTSEHQRPGRPSRATSTPVIRRRQSAQRGPGYPHEGEGLRSASKHVPPPLNLDHKDNVGGANLKLLAQDRERSRERHSPQRPFSMPLPPFSIPTFLSLELSAEKPSPLYIYQPSNTEFPYESSRIRYERLLNFMVLPHKLEGVLGFGALACLDAWLYNFTILPLRFLLALWILVKWWGSVVLKEIRDLWSFVYNGLGRVWRRRRNPDSQAPTPVASTPAEEFPPSRSRRPSTSAATMPNAASSQKERNTVPTLSAPESRERRSRPRYRHRRTKSTPSALLPNHKADILKGLLVLTSCAVLMRFDASRMYHGIRGQATIKLYVIYNVLEFLDRLLSAVGQDALECLFSRETLDRNADGRSKVIRPFGMFILALVYNVAHAMCLFYQVITLNVAVNSYSNALLTLLLSNQFVEIKGTVFKKFEKENLFQLTCADIVERFQLWLMLLIIGMRNVVEVGGLSIRSSDSPSWSSAFGNGNSTAPFSASSILPRSFTIFPEWIGQVLNPFLLVLGSEMLVDWLKHAYITKFNQTKPAIYTKFLDVLAKDYYTNAFSSPNLTRRLGLPVLPLACLFIRAVIQTYHMFVAIHMPSPFPSTATSLTSSSAPTTSPATTAALEHIDQLFRRALGRSARIGPSGPWTWHTALTFTFDDIISFLTLATIFVVIYLIMLCLKLVLGMILLSIARNRYAGMKEREMIDTRTGGKMLGGFGVIDVDEEKRRWIYNDDPEGLKRLRERDEKGRREGEREKKEGSAGVFERVERYSMVAKRIW